MQLIKLQKELDNLNLIIFTLNDVIKITGQKKEIVKVFLSNQIKKNLLYRLKKNFYSFKKITNKFVLAKIYSKSYVALNSALEFYKTTTQQYNNLELISKTTLKSQTINNVKIQNHKIRENLFFGYEKERIDNIDFFISNIEKTIIDCVYFSNKVYLSETIQFIKLKKENIDQRDFIIKQIPELSSFGTQRDFIAKVIDFSCTESEEDEFNKNKFKVKISFELSKGSYATIVVKKMFAQH